MRRQREKYIKKDKQKYDHKAFYDPVLVGRKEYMTYKTIMRGKTEYLLGDTSDVYFKNLFENEIFLDYMNRVQVLGLRDIGEITVECDIDEYTKGIFTFSVFNNMRKTGVQRFFVKDGQVEITGWDKSSYADKVASYVMFGDIMLEFNIKIQMDVARLKEDTVLVINSIVSELEFIGDFDSLKGRELGGFIREAEVKYCRGEFYIINKEVVFNGVKLKTMEDLFIADYNFCIYKDCILCIYGNVFDTTSYRYYSRHGNRIEAI